MTYEGKVVVAVDDVAQPDVAVLDWAAAEAASRGTGLVVCHVCEWQIGQQPPRPMYESVDPTLRIGPERVVGAALDRVRAGHPDLVATGAVGVGDVVRGLLQVGEEAALIVLGARGLGGFSGLLMGSVAGQVAEHAACPVVVVRGSTAGATDVVVGIDGSPGSARALDLGLAQARRTGGTLVALHAYRLAPVGAAYAPGLDDRSQHEQAVRTLDEALGTVDADHPDVKIERRVEHGPAARVLLAAAHDAAVLAVGARGLGGFTGLIAGSVSQQVLRHARCPVLVAR